MQRLFGFAHRPRRASCLLLLIGSTLCAQGTVGGKPVKSGDDGGVAPGGTQPESATLPPLRPDQIPPPRYELRGTAVVEVRVRADRSLGERPVSPTEHRDLRRAGKIPPMPAKGMFSALASTRPRRLTSGQSGVLHVVAVLARDTVVVPGALATASLPDGIAPIRFGTQEVGAARPGTVARHFLGQPIHDETVTIRIPVTAATDAKAGKYTLPGTVELEVSNGTTGQLLGVFSCPVTATLTIGPPIPDPAVRPGSTAGKQPRDNPHTASRAPAAIPQPDGAPRPEAKRPPPDKPASSLERPTAPDKPAPAPQPTADMVWMVGGVGLVVIVVVLMSRRRD
ncbi:MAG: hypothetical protein KDC87_21625 [Planctomycetes bacterium]|nr:hypothetical protein [Planctomycetota bacterium]